MHRIDQVLQLSLRGRFDDAWKVCEQLEDLKQKKLLTNDEIFRHDFNRGWFLITQGKYQEGFQLLESGRMLQSYGDPRPSIQLPIWHPSDSLNDKTVLIVLEGGLGDHIIMARFAKEIKLRGGTCVVATDKSLVSVLSRVDGIDRCISKDLIEYKDCDYWIPGFSCSWLFGTTFDTLPNTPYLSVDPSYDQKWKNIIPNKGNIRIGLRWSGNPKFEHQQFRKFNPIGMVTNILLAVTQSKKTVDLYSLQRDHDLMDLPDNIVDLNTKFETWEDTLACINQLDLVISSCTSVVHAAAALGKPTWVITPVLPYHIWAYGKNTSPWYPNVKVYRQELGGIWTHCFEQLRTDLTSLINSFNER